MRKSEFEMTIRDLRLRFSDPTSLTLAGSACDARFQIPAWSGGEKDGAGCRPPLPNSRLRQNLQIVSQPDPASNDLRESRNAFANFAEVLKSKNDTFNFLTSWRRKSQISRTCEIYI